jgi:pimeloyl-ACP methyl ester carboxylesterase
VSTPIHAELRYWPELARLIAAKRFRAPDRGDRRRTVLLIPGFLAGDASLTVLAGWLRRRGHEVRMSGIRVNADCAGRELTRLQKVLGGSPGPVVVIGQSRGGTLARALAASRPQSIAALVTLGSPVLDPLAVSPVAMRSIRAVARLGDLGVPGMLSTGCRDGGCCRDFEALLRKPLHPGIVAVAVYSRSDAIVDWRACLDPHADCVEVGGSHCGMAVNPDVYRLLERVLDGAEDGACIR